MRVLHLYWEPARSGISEHVLTVVGLPTGAQHAALLPPGLDGVADALRRAGARVEPAPVRPPLPGPQALWAVVRAVREARPDVLHVHALEAALTGLVVARLAGSPPVVLQPQTIDSRRPALLAPYLAAVRAAGGGRATWLAVSTGQAGRLQRSFPAARVVRVSNALPAAEGPPPGRDEARARLGWPAGATVVAFVGRLAAQKDPLTFVRAAAGAPSLLHVLVGDGPLRAEVAAAAAGAANVRLQGRVAGIDDVLAGADVLALPSRWEGMSLALLAALERGLPVAASAIEGNADLVEHERTGLTFRPGDVDGLRVAIARLAADADLRARLAAAGRARAAALCGRDVVAAGLRDAWAAARGGP